MNRITTLVAGWTMLALVLLLGQTASTTPTRHDTLMKTHKNLHITADGCISVSFHTRFRETPERAELNLLGAPAPQPVIAAKELLTLDEATDVLPERHARHLARRELLRLRRSLESTMTADIQHAVPRIRELANRYGLEHDFGEPPPLDPFWQMVLARANE